MTNLLVKWFIKDNQNIQNSKVRENYGKLGGIVGIIINCLLFAGKFLVGTLFQSVSIVADAVNNLSDAGSSVISLVSFKLSNKPADRKHPFGHARMEYIASLVVAFLILMLGFELVRSSVDKIFRPDAIRFSYITVAVLVISIFAKLWLYLFNRKLGKKIDSTVMQATAADSLSDVAATSGVLISTIVSPLLHFQLDGYMGVAVAVFIIISGINILRDTMDHLLGQAPDAAFIESVNSYIMKYDGILGTHDLMVHSYGPQRCFASVHAEVDAGEDILKSHDIIDNIERDIETDMGIHLVIHLDPIVTGDETVNELRDFTQKIVKKIDPVLSIHDFRVVIGNTHSNLIFDIVVPFEFSMGDDEIISAVKEKIAQRDQTLYAVITLDRS